MDVKRWAAACAGSCLFWATGALAAAPKVGQPAPAFEASTFGGHKVSLDDLKGDVVILNFWATWCGPCRKELPLLEGYFRYYAKYGLQVLAVTTEDSVTDYQLKPIAAKLTIPFVKRMKGPYHELEGVPTNYVIDRSGKLVYAKAAAFTIEDLNALVVPLLREPIPEEAKPTAPQPTTAAPAPAVAPAAPAS